MTDKQDATKKSMEDSDAFEFDEEGRPRIVFEKLGKSGGQGQYTGFVWGLL